MLASLLYQGCNSLCDSVKSSNLSYELLRMILLAVHGSLHPCTSP